MSKPVSMRQYLSSIKDLVLPEPHSDVTGEFVKHVVGAHSWWKHNQFSPSSMNLLAFNFYVGPGPLVERAGGLNERIYDHFQHLKYSFSGLFEKETNIPREIYDAGLAIIPGTRSRDKESDYRSEQSQGIMVSTIANMLRAVEYYKERHKK